MPELTVKNDLWSLLKAELKDLFPAEVFEMWFEPLVCLKSTVGELHLGAPNDFASIWIQDNYLDLLTQRACLLQNGSVKVKLGVSEACVRIPGKEEQGDRRNGGTEPEDAARPRNARRARRIYEEDGQLNPRNVFGNFIVGPNNHLAHAACVAVAQAPAQAYNPLFLYGDTGLGKTHLMQAVGHFIHDGNDNARIAYITTEKFTNEYITAIQENTLAKFRRRYRSADILLVDDIQFLGGKERIQEEFFHTFNELFESQKQIILTSDRPASEIARIENRLVSRFQWGLTADVQAPELETRTAILQSKARQLNCPLDDAILNFIAERVTRNIRRLEGALLKVASFSSLTGKKIDVAAAENLLHDVLQEEAQQKVTIEKIKEKTVEYFQLRPADMVSRRRPANIAFPRQIAMYLCRILTNHSLQEIGDAFGGRDHGTVIHACKTVANAMEQDSSGTGKTIDYLKNQLTRLNK